MTYAGFWKRVAAYLVDSFIYFVIMYIAAFVLGLLLAVSTPINPNALSAGQDLLLKVLGSLLSLTCYLTYYVWAESSPWQATVGKKLMGLKVTDIYGRRISFWRALGRRVGMIVSGLTLGIGYLMCIWTAKKQCLHDKMASCLVVDETPGQKVGCVWAVLVVWLLFAVFMGVAGMLATVGLMGNARAEQYQRQDDMNQIQERLRQAVEKVDFDNLENNA